MQNVACRLKSAPASAHLVNKHRRDPRQWRQHGCPGVHVTSPGFLYTGHDFANLKTFNVRCETALVADAKEKTYSTCHGNKFQCVMSFIKGDPLKAVRRKFPHGCFSLIRMPNVHNKDFAHCGSWAEAPQGHGNCVYPRRSCLEILRSHSRICSWPGWSGRMHTAFYRSQDLQERPDNV